ETAKSGMAEAHDALDAALQRQFPGGMLKRSWNGDVLELSGPGASGSIIFEDGKLIGRASLKPPASMMRAVIEEKVGAAMREAASA
ncbi:MAG: polyhydroxyalkanoic acid system family protein, partial [Acidobacteriota bacterium]